MYCRTCWYPLRNLETQACPECGRSFDAADARTFRKIPRARWGQMVLLRTLTSAALFLIIGGLLVYVILDAISPVDQPARVRKLGMKASKGDQGAIDSIRQIADELYENIDYSKEKERVLSNLALMKAAFEPMAVAAGDGSEKALDALFYANRVMRLRSFVPDAMGIAAAMGNRNALEALLNHHQHGWLLSSTVFALQRPAENGDPEAINFLIEVVEDDGARALWHGATQGLIGAARDGDERAKRALQKYAAYKQTRN